MRLIDADKLEPSEVYMNYGFTRIVYMDDIDEMPTVDAVEVVRCKDCKYASPNGNGCTVYHFKRYETHNMSPDDFCSWGERKDETN